VAGRKAFSGKMDAMYSLKKQLENRRSESGRSSPSKTICVFRFGGSGLYAFTADPRGHILPSRIYPRLRWQFQRRVTLPGDGKSPMADIVKATLDAIEKHGFHLAHAAINAQLLALAAQCCDEGIDPQEQVSQSEHGYRGGEDAKN
jgi:hypothetical protein